MRIYVASSWRNIAYPEIVAHLREAGHEVYDFRNPAEGNHGFHWSAISESWDHWTPQVYRHALHHPLAKQGYASDFGAMQWAEACVLVLPCGRSAHLEAGWFVGAGRPLHIILTGEIEPELMYKMATTITVSIPELMSVLGSAA